MTTVAVLGAGTGGAASAAELTIAGHAVRLWNRSAETLEPFRRRGGVGYRGELGEGTAEPLLTTNLREAIEGADVALVCLPAVAHPAVFEGLAEVGASILLVLNPGGVGGALELRETFRRRDAPLPPVAELSTLTYVGRKYEPDTVTVTGVARRVWGSALPGGRESLDAVSRLYPAVAQAPDVLFTSLSNVNLVLHPPGAILAAAWVEATGGAFRFYGEGMTPGVVRVLEALDDERRAVGAAFGHALPSLIQEMAEIGTAAIQGGAANARIQAPASLDHRYYREDLGFGLQPFTKLASIADVSVPLATSLLALGTTLSRPGRGRDAERMGIEGMDAAELLRSVREEGS